MSAAVSYRLALANLPYPESREDSVEQAVRAIAAARSAGAQVLCFPECYVPGYRLPGVAMPAPDRAFLEAAWARIARAAGEHRVGVILGTERWDEPERALRITALVIRSDGSIDGFQDKVQLDPSEEVTYRAGEESACRRVFEAGELKFGVSICHEGWRYPETVRAPVRKGAQVVFHPHYHWAEAGSYRPATFLDPRSSFHEKAMLCRAAENTCFFASVNYASDGSPTTSAVVAPDGTVLAWQPYGVSGLLVVDVDLTQATGLLARRWKPAE